MRRLADISSFENLQCGVNSSFVSVTNTFDYDKAVRRFMEYWGKMTNEPGSVTPEAMVYNIAEFIIRTWREKTKPYPTDMRVALDILKDDTNIFRRKLFDKIEHKNERFIEEMNDIASRFGLEPWDGGGLSVDEELSYEDRGKIESLFDKIMSRVRDKVESIALGASAIQGANINGYYDYIQTNRAEVPKENALGEMFGEYLYNDFVARNPRLTDPDDMALAFDDEFPMIKEALEDKAGNDMHERWFLMGVLGFARHHVKNKIKGV